MFPRFPSPGPLWADATLAPERFARLRRLSLGLAFVGPARHRRGRRFPSASGFGRTNLAVALGSAEAVTALLEAGANPNVWDENGETPLHRAASLGRAEVVTVLSEAGAAMEAQAVGDATALHLAAALGGAEAVTALLPPKCSTGVEKNQAGLAGTELRDGSGRVDPLALDARHTTFGSASTSKLRLSSSLLSPLGWPLDAAVSAGGPSRCPRR